MARAICERNHIYGWPNKRGYRLADFPCPVCGAKGKAVRDYKLANRLEAKQSEWARSKCPICGQGYPHKVDYKPVTCGSFACLQEASRRGLLKGV